MVAPRGTIYDRTGSALALSYTTYNVYVRAREVEEKALVAHTLATILDLSFDKVYLKISKSNVSEVLIKMQVESDIAEKIYNYHYKGVYLIENSNRYYPYGNLLSQVLGFTSVDNIGQTGVEAYYNNNLKGEDGFSYVQSDLQGKEIGGSLRYYMPSIPGTNLKLSIDSKIELIVEEVLEKIMLEQKAKATTGVVLNPNNGEILALSTKPSFDLNDIPRDDLQQLFEFSKVKPATDIYEPGSTFKILTLAAALEAKVVNLNDRFYCPGYRIVDGKRIKCWKTIGHGSQSLKEAFANSCNCCFMDLAMRLGVDRFYNYMKNFGLGSKTGIDVSGEQSGIMMPKNNVKKVDLARMGFGHAIALTPIQLLTAVSSIVNGGTYNTPHILNSLANKSGEFQEKTIYKQKEKIVSEDTSKIINQLLEFAENKKGKYTFVEGYNVGGKTGVLIS